MKWSTSLSPLSWDCTALTWEVVASVTMKTSNCTPSFHFCVPWSTRRVISSAPPSTQSETATVMTPAAVMSLLRRSDTHVSRAKYLNLDSMRV